MIGTIPPVLKRKSGRPEATRKRGVFAHLFHRRHEKKSDVTHRTASPLDAPSSNTSSCSTCETTFHTVTKCLSKGEFSSFGVECDETGVIEEQAPPQFTASISARYMNTNYANKEPSGILVDSHADHYASTETTRVLQEGGVLFSFSCPHSCDDFEQSMLDTVANLSSFENETRENFAPIYVSGRDKYAFVFSRCSYLLPGVDIHKLCDAEFLASASYHRACQPNGTHVWDDDRDNTTTFRITKPVIPYLFNLTVQFKVSEIGGGDLERLSALVGMPVDCGLLLERTKRNSKRQDSTRKAKSVLLYTQVEGGILVNHITVILQSSLPLVIAMAIHQFGGRGLGEACETVEKTREYTRATIPAKDDASRDD